MQTESLIHFITRGMLSLKDNELEQTIRCLEEIYPQVDWKTPQKVDSYSVAGVLPSGETVGFLEWLTELRKSGAQKIQVRDEPFSETEAALPPHVAAAFENGVSSRVEILCGDRMRIYAPISLSSSGYSISGPELEALFDAQFPAGPMRTSLWMRLLEKDVTRCGGYFDATTEDQARDFTRDIRSWFATSDLLKTAQYFCAEAGQSFQIPDHLRQHLHRENRSELERKIFAQQNPGREKEFVPDSEQIYFGRSITPGEYVEFIDAQGFKEGSAESQELWSRLQKLVFWVLRFGDKKLPEPFFEGQNISDFRKAFLGLNEKTFADIPGGNLSQLVQEFVRGQDRPLVVPDCLKETMRTNTQNRKSLVSEDDLWRPNENPHPWQMLLHTFVSEKSALHWQQPIPHTKARQEFLVALKRAQVFAHKNNNSFEEAFRLTAWILESSQKWNSKQGFLNAKQSLPAAGFSEKAQRALERRADLASVCEALRTSEEEARALYALSVGNVFGGMGSWSDQYFEGAAQEEDEQITSDLFSALRNFSSSIGHRLEFDC